MSSSRWLAVGSAVLGVGALLAISWLVYAWQSHVSFWAWPGTVGVVIGGSGVLMLVAGLIIPDDESSVRQIQQGGIDSVNIQAGRDVNLPRDTSGE